MIGSDKLILNKSKETTNKILGGSLGNELDRAIIVEEDAQEDKTCLVHSKKSFCKKIMLLKKKLSRMIL